MKITIKGAKILSPASSYHGKVVDVTIDKGKITHIGKVSSGNEQVIEAKGMYLTIGWFDMRSWFADPGYEHKEDMVSGLEAATAGGFTGVALLPNTSPVIDSKNDINYLKSYNGRYLTNVFPYGAVTRECKGEELTEMTDLHHAGAVGFTDGLKPVWHTDIILKVLQYLQPFNGLVINKAEDKWLNMFGQMHEGEVSTGLGMKGMPALGEELMISRDLDILRYSAGKLHFSVISTEGAVDLIKKAKKEGLKITCDVASYQPLLKDEALVDYEANFKVNPPLRDNNHNKKLLRGLKDGTIDIIVSNHIPQDTESKNLEFDLADFGMISLQTVAANLVELSNDIEWDLLIEKVTTNPRNLLNIPVPAIEEGNEAELTLLDPNKAWIPDEKNILSKSFNSPYMGKTITGKVKAVFNNGKSWIEQE
ncbi:MAG: dihydroorotase [Candidatus Cyclobacteriaceae bacterium M2_1C_046]